MGYRPTRCKFCGRQADVDVRISKRGACQDCAMVRMEQHAQAMLDRSGPLYEEWVRKCQVGYEDWLDFAEALGRKPQAASHWEPGD